MRSEGENLEVNVSFLNRSRPTIRYLFSAPFASFRGQKEEQGLGVPVVPPASLRV